jgi:hypothetical protein
MRKRESPVSNFDHERPATFGSAFEHESNSNTGGDERNDDW